MYASKLAVAVTLFSLLSVPSVARGQEPPPDLALTIEKQEDEWVFVVTGTTSLPPGALLKTRIFAVDLVHDPRPDGGKPREDEEPLVWEGDGEAAQPAYRPFELIESRFRVEALRFRRKPWSIRYRARVDYTPALQNDRVRLLAGDAAISLFADLHYGTAGDYAKELKERALGARTDYQEVEALFASLKDRYRAHRETHDFAAWTRWKLDWSGRLDRLANQNKERYGLWIVWKERKAKMRIGGLCILLRGMVEDAERTIQGETPRRPLNEERLKYFTTLLLEEYPAPVLPKVMVEPSFADYERGFAPVRTWIREGEGDWKEVKGPARTTCFKAIIDLLEETRAYKRTYNSLNELAGTLSTLIRRADSGTPALAEAFENHDRALARFKNLAGLDRDDR